MLITKKFKQLFHTHKASNVLGVALRQQNLAFCYLTEQALVQCQLLDYSDLEPQIGINKLVQTVAPQGCTHLVLSANDYQLVQVDKPQVPENEVVNALKWQIKDLVSYSPTDIILDYFDGPTGQAGSQKLNVVCASKALLQKLVDGFAKTEAPIKQISIEEFAFTALLPKSDEACILVCQQPNEEVHILIVKQGILYFHRRLRGFSQIGERSTEELSFGILDSLSVEIQRSSDYFERQLKQAPIRAIKVLLPVEHEGFIARKLAENSNVAVELLELPEQYQENRAFAASIGALKLSEFTAMEGQHGG